MPLSAHSMIQHRRISCNEPSAPPAGERRTSSARLGSGRLGFVPSTEPIAHTLVRLGFGHACSARMKAMGTVGSGWVWI